MSEVKKKMRLRSLLTIRWISRAWYYFRLGYGTYLTFVLGYVSTLVTVYYLAVKNMPPLLDVFPHFASFAIPATGLGAPLAVLLGWVHFKRSSFFSSEADIAIEANPYAYKLQPGYVTEVNTPVMLLELKILKRLAETGGLLTDSEKAEFERLQSKLKVLLEGGYVGSPRRKM